MSRRDDQNAGDGLTDWLAGLSDPPDDEAAGDPPTVPTNPPTVPANPPTVPAPADDLVAPSTGDPTGYGGPGRSAIPADPDGSEDGARRSGWRLWLLAAIPWLLVISVALTAWPDVGATDQPDNRTDRSPASATGKAEAPTGDAGDDVQPDAETGGLAGGSEPPAAELAATAETAVRTVGARQLGDGAEESVHIGYARATRASSFGDDLVVITVAALARHADGERWGEPTAVRFAVVVGSDGGLREPPWPLPASGLTTDSPQPADLSPVDMAAADERVDAATSALAQAGYDRPDVQTLHRVGDDRALRVEAVARPPGAQQRVAVMAWLTPDGRRVLGHRPAASDAAAADDASR